MTARATDGELEKALLERLRAGDEAAFSSLVKTHHAPLVRVIRNYVRDASAAEEVAQDTWFAVFRGVAAFEGRSTFRSWLYSIALNKARTRGSREARSKPFSSLVAEELGAPEDYLRGRFRANGHWSEPPVAWSPDRASGGGEIVALVERFLPELPELQRLVVTLRDVQDLDPEEVCALLEITEANQRVLLHRGRSKLRELIETAWGR